jgi:hypothetical protein
MYNTIKIKRRLAGSGNSTPPSLAGGEIAYNEVNHILYYGAEAGTMAIAGSGHYVSLGTEQTVTGDKTFSGTTTLGNTNFSPGVNIDFNGNRLRDIATPIESTDVSTKGYVDGLSANAVDLHKNQTIAGEKTFSNNALFSQNVTVNGDLTVLGAATKLETTTTVFSSFEVYNVGETVAFKVTQTNSTDIAQFVDDSTTALIIKNGGNVGINDVAPAERLTVAGNISASGNIYARGDLYVQGNEIYLGDGDGNNVTIQPLSPTTDNDAADLIITGVRGLNNANAEGSDISILGGDSYLDSGPGDRIGHGGEVLIQGGTGATGGNIEVRGGTSDAASTDGVSDGGNVDISGGVSTYGHGGNVTIVAGYATNGTGAGTYVRSGVLNIGVATSDVSSKTVQISGDGRTFFPGPIVAFTQNTPLEGFVLDGGEF